MQLSLQCGVVGLILLATTHAAAAEWHVAEQSPGAQSSTGSPLDIATTHLAAQVVPLRLQGVSLTAGRVLSSGSTQTVRLAQLHQGVEVIGGQVAVRIVDGTVRAVVLDVARALDVDVTPTTPALEAEHIAATRANAPAAAVASTDLRVLASLHGGRLVWSVDVRTLDGGWRYLVDAHSGHVVASKPLAVHALGRVYPISSAVTPATQDLELLDLVPSTPQYLNGWNGQLAVTNYVSGDTMNNNYVVEQTVEPNSGEDFLYDPPVDPTDVTDAFAQVGIFFHLTRMRNFATNSLGVDMSAANWGLVAVANMQEGGMPYGNAFFSQLGIAGAIAAPNLIAIGQAASFDFAQDSDVFNHEFTHYLTHNAIDYNAGRFHLTDFGRSPFSAAVDEGLSDYFSCTVNGDQILGEASLALGDNGVRDLGDTSKVCPDDMGGEPHADGEIIGSFSWSLREMFGATIADALVWNAATLLTYGATFGDYARAVLQAADDMVSTGTLTPQERDSIDALLVTRGLDQCDAEVPLEIGASIELSLRGFPSQFCDQAKADGRFRGALFHYWISPDPEAEAIGIQASMIASEPDDFKWEILARQGEHVTFTVDFPPVIDAFDYQLSEQVGSDGELIIDASSVPPFDPNATYHFILRSQSCVRIDATLTARNILPEAMNVGGNPGAGGAGGATNPSSGEGDIVVDDGCGCSTPGRRGSRWGWAMVALGLAVAARRRRRC